MEFDRFPPLAGEGFDRYGPARPARPARGNAYPSSHAGSSRMDQYVERTPRPINLSPRAPAPRPVRPPKIFQSADDYSRSLAKQSRPPPRNTSNGYGDNSSDYIPSARRPSRPNVSARSEYSDPYRRQATREDTRYAAPRRAREPSPDYTSDADEGGQAPGVSEAEGAWSWNKLKKTVWGETARDEAAQRTSLPEEDHAQVEQDAEGQNTLWSKIAFVKETLQKKINRDEGYASDASDYEEANESAAEQVLLNRYHVEKAQSKRDLPTWLFTDAEIGAAGAQVNQRIVENSPTPRAMRQRPGRYDKDGSDEIPASRPTGLSDIFDSVNQEKAYSNMNSPGAKQSFDSGYGSSTSSSRNKYRNLRDDMEIENSPKRVGRNRLADLPAMRGGGVQRTRNPNIPTHLERTPGSSYAEDWSSEGRSIPDYYSSSRSETGWSGRAAPLGQTGGNMPVHGRQPLPKSDRYESMTGRAPLPSNGRPMRRPPR